MPWTKNSIVDPQRKVLAPTPYVDGQHGKDSKEISGPSGRIDIPNRFLK